MEKLIMTITFQYIEGHGMSSGHKICKFSEFFLFFLYLLT